MDHKKICIFTLVIVLICVYLYWEAITAPKSHDEKFSTSGLPISDIDCEKLATVYKYPKNAKNINKICAKDRRKNVYNNTGNYYTVNGNLV
jgi:hypothetical protein